MSAVKSTAKKATWQKRLRAMPFVICSARYTATELLENRPFSDIAEVWAGNERGKTALRAKGTDPVFLSGVASGFEKTNALFKALGATVGSTLYSDALADATLLSAEKSFLSGDAGAFWQETASALLMGEWTPARVLSGACLSLLPTALPLAGELSLPQGHLPLVEVDDLVSVGDGAFLNVVLEMEKALGKPLRTLSEFEEALAHLLRRAALAGTTALSLNLSQCGEFEKPNPYHAGQIFDTAMAGKGHLLSPSELALWRAQFLRTLGKLLREQKMRLVCRMTPQNKPRCGAYSIAAVIKTLTYLKEWGALPPTLFTFPADTIPTDVGALANSFFEETGAPLVYLGIEASGQTPHALRGAIRRLLGAGLLPLFLGMCDDDRGALSSPARARFGEALVDVLLEWQGDGIGFGDDSVLSGALEQVWYKGLLHFFAPEKE